MRAHFLSQSGFAIEGEESALIFDYFKNAPAGEKSLKGGIVTPEKIAGWGEVYVFVSHFHPDHFNQVVLSWQDYANVTYIVSRDVIEHNASVRFPKYIEVVGPGDMFSTGKIKCKVFGSTDEGVSYFVGFGGKNIFHAGDLNLWAWRNEPEAEYIEAAKASFEKEMSFIEKGIRERIDAAFFPVDRRMEVEYWEGASIFAKKMRPSVFVPMHFTPPFVAPAEFEKELDALGIKLAPVVHRGDCFDF